MDTMAPIRPIVRSAHRISLTAGPAAAAEARTQVRAALDAWGVPVDVSVAVLLTNELVTNAITHDPGGAVMVAISCAYGQLHVDVHDTSRSMPVPVESPAVDAEFGRGLMLVANLATTWGYYPTPTGKAVYFTLAFQAER
jgi:anti-sigma regulatory factor (Ser/Thr protein kinase)